MELEERCLAELELVASAYGPEEAWCKNQDEVPIIHRRLSLLKNDMQAQVILAVTMPPGYPADDTLDISATLEEATHPQIQKLAWNALPKFIESCRTVAQYTGEEALWTVLMRADEWVEDEWPSFAERLPNEPGKKAPCLSTSKPTSIVLGRRLIYSHHIIAMSKRKAIQDLTSQYHLTGRAKIGWPGIILIEGREENCCAFVDQIRSMTWKYLVVRGEQQEQVISDTELEKKRKFDSFHELEDMSILAKQCRERDLECLFVTCMKIYAGNEASNSQDECDNIHHQHGALVHVDHMNCGKTYRKWLRKASRDTHCTLLLVKQFFLNQDFTKRPIIIVAIVANQQSLRGFLKRWRTSRVDVDSKGHPCLERKMSVLSEGPIDIDLSQSEHDSSLHAEDQTNTTFGQLSEILRTIGGEIWLEAVQHTIIDKHKI